MSRRRFVGLGAGGQDKAGIVIGAACFATRGIVCQICADHCSAQAIHFRPRRGNVPEPLLEQARCTGCGDCVSICPADAIGSRPPHV
ncbi:MAG TPA: 4Fe-4S dicluster domain-containing protein [Rhodopila sp.]